MALAVALLPRLSVAALTGNGPPSPQLRGPSSLSTSQAFTISFYYPKGKVKSYSIEFFHCQAGSTVRPSNDNNTDPFPVQGCEPPKTSTPSLISPDTGQVTIDVKKGVTSIHQYQTKNFSARDTERWLEGNWYVRVRLFSLSDAVGPWSKWHRTVIGSGNIGKPIGTSGLMAGRHRVNSSLVMRGLKPPIIAAPMQGAIMRGGIGTSGTLPAHARYSDWRCCDIQWQRAVIVAKENGDYVKAHTPPGAVPQSAFPGPRGPWTGPGLHNGSHPLEHAPSFAGSWGYDVLRPRSREFGYQYWFRIREHFVPGNASGPWSAWRSFIVQEPAAPRTLNHAGMRPLPGAATPGSHTMSGQQHNSRQLAPMAPLHRLDMPVRPTLTR